MRKGKVSIMNKRMIIITALLAYLLCFHCAIQAQLEYRWQAVSIRMSNNGRYLAIEQKSKEWIDDISDYGRGIWIYDLENLLSPPQYLSELPGYFPDMEYSPNSQYLAVGGYERLRVFNTENNAVILDSSSSATPTRYGFTRLSFSPDSSYIASFSYYWEMEYEMSIWDVHTGQRIHTVTFPGFPGGSRHWNTAPWLSPDWRQFLDWSDESSLVTIYEFDAQRGLGQKTGSITTNHWEIGTKFSPDSSFFALATWDDELQKGIIQVYETDAWTLKNSIAIHESPCGPNEVLLTFAHNHPWLATTCEWDRTLSVWNYETNELVFRDENSLIGGSEFTLDDAFLITSRYSAPQEFATSVLNIEKGFELIEYPGVYTQFHPNSELMASIGPDSRIWIWNIKQDQPLVILPIPQNRESRRFAG